MDPVLRSICLLDSQPPYYLVGLLGCIKPLALLKIFGKPKIADLVETFDAEDMPQDDHCGGWVRLKDENDADDEAGVRFEGTRFKHKLHEDHEVVQQMIRQASTCNKNLMVCLCAGLSVVTVLTDIHRSVAVLRYGGTIWEIATREMFVLGISTFPATAVSLNGLANLYAQALGETPLQFWEVVKDNSNISLAIKCSKGMLWFKYWKWSMRWLKMYTVNCRLIFFIACCVYPWLMVLFSVVGFSIGGKGLQNFAMQGVLPMIAIRMTKNPVEASLEVKQLDVPNRAWGAYFHFPLLFGVLMPFFAPCAARFVDSFARTAEVIGNVDINGTCNSSCHLSLSSIGSLGESFIGTWSGPFNTSFNGTCSGTGTCLGTFDGSSMGDGYLGSIGATWEDRHLHNYLQSLLVRAMNATEVAHNLAEQSGSGHIAQWMTALTAWLLTLTLVV